MMKTVIEIYHFYLKERKSENVISLFVTFITKKNYVVHIRALKQTLNQELILKKEESHRGIKKHA